MRFENLGTIPTVLITLLLSLTQRGTRLEAFETTWVRNTVPPQSQSSSASDIATDNLSSIYVTGFTDGDLAPTHVGGRDAYLMKYDTAGNLIWAREFGTSTGSEGGSSVAADPLNNVLVVGNTGGSLAATNQGYSDAFARKYDSAGNTLWTRQFGTTNEDSAEGVATDLAGNVLITGNSRIPGTPGSSTNAADAYLRKFDPNGNLLWQKTIDSAADDYGHAVGTDAMGNSYIAGTTYGSLAGPKLGGTFDNDAFLIKFAPDGTLLWSRQFGTISYDIPQDIVVDALGNSYVAGSLNSVAFVEKFDSAGNSLWTQQLVSGSSTAYSVALDSLGRVYTSGVNGIGGSVQFYAQYSADGTPTLLVFDSEPSANAPHIALDAFNSTYLYTGYYAGNNMDGLRLMKLASVPEPTTLALCVWISAALTQFRRRMLVRR